MEIDQLLSSPLVEWINAAEEEDSDLNSFLVAASVAYEQETGSSHKQSPTPPINTSSTSGFTPSASYRFTPPKSDADMQRERERAVPKNTKKDTVFCMNIWQEWTKHRLQTTGTAILGRR